jgi:hypothetical protein
VLVLTSLCVVVPLWLTTERAALRARGPLFVYFAAIGLGFMLVEISQMQRLIIFLGHPTYGLSVVLFAMLLSSGIGSLLSGAVGGAGRTWRRRRWPSSSAYWRCSAATPLAIRAFEAATTPGRIAVAVVILFPIGLLMGMAFPLGMRLASARAPALTPWLWGERRDLGVRVGPGGGDRAQHGDRQLVLDGRGVLRRGGAGLHGRPRAARSRARRRRLGGG